MQSVGTNLGEARKKLGFTLDEISARTRISVKNLDAIEADEANQISSPFLYRSFVRQYAAEVQVDYNQLEPAVQIVSSTMRQPELPGQGEYQPVRVPRINVRLKRDIHWILPASYLVGTIALCSFGYVAYKQFKPKWLLPLSSVSGMFRSAPPPLRGPAPAPANKADASVANVTAHTASPQNAAPAPTAAAQVTPPPPSPGSAELIASDAPAASPAETKGAIHIELSAIERTWLSATADGKTAYRGILEAAQTKILEGHRSASVSTANAGAVSITFNGRSLPAIGPRGKLRTVVFTKTGYQVRNHGRVEMTRINRIGG